MRNRYKTEAEKRADYLGYQRGYHAGVKKSVKHGRWVEKPFEFHCEGITTYSSVTDTVCSVCGESAIEYMESPYCPWCGAKMDEVEEDGRLL